MKLRLGPGAMVAAAFIGPGTLTTAATTGASSGLALAWTILFTCRDIWTNRLNTNFPQTT